MIGAKSQGSTLTSKAFTNYTDFSWTYRCIGTQFTNVDNYTCSIRWSISPPESDHPYGGQRFNSITFNGSTTNNLQHQELEFSVQVLDYNTENVYFETDWYPVNTIVNIGAKPQLRGGERLNSYRVYIRRSDGSQLNRTSLNACICTVYGQRYQTVEEQTLPADWFATTTQTNVFIPLVTVTTPIETYQGTHGGGGGERGVVYDLNYYLEIPQEVAGVVSYIFYLFGQIASLKYVTTLICLAMVLGTLRFIMR